MDIEKGKKIGVLVKTSFVDFPGRVAAALFLCGCNLRCPYCYNKDLVTSIPPEADMNTFSEVMLHLEKRRNVLSGFVISGGEPTISPYTEQLIYEAKKLGYYIKLDTNGIFPEKIKYFLDSPIAKPDFIALDIKTSPSRYDLMLPGSKGDILEKNLIETINLVSTLPQEKREYRTVLVPGLVSEKDINQIANLLPKDASWRLSRFRPGECLDSNYNNIQPYTDDEYNNLLSIASKSITNVEIR